jgi:cell wall-associated NlpC family hydrolase
MGLDYGKLFSLKLDCWSLCREVYNQIGRHLPQYVETIPDYVDEINKEITIHKHEFIKLNGPEPWCLVLLRSVRNIPVHVGVVLPDLMRFIHSINQQTVISRLSTYSSKIEGFYKYREH